MCVHMCACLNVCAHMCEPVKTFKYCIGRHIQWWNTTSCQLFFVVVTIATTLDSHCPIRSKTQRP